MKQLHILSALAAVAVFVGNAHADPSATGASTAMPSVLRLVAAFGVVVALVYALSFVMRRATARRAGGSRRIMDVVDVLPLGPKTRLVTVKIGGQFVVVGAGESSVNRIAEIDPSMFPQLVDADTPAIIPFRQRLRKLAGK